MLESGLIPPFTGGRQGHLDPEWGSCEPRSIKELPGSYE